MNSSIRKILFNKKGWQKIIAIAALLNFLLVLFNLTYIPLRDAYLRYIPALVELYDPVKSITRHPDTEKYLTTVEQLKQHLEDSPLDIPETRNYFAKLREQSHTLLTENSFSVANKFGTFAQLKRRIEEQMNTESAPQAFNEFWTVEYFAEIGTENALTFFDKKLKPLFRVNYFRPVDENGQFIDYFWRIDVYFIVFFAIEFLVRTWFIAKKYEELSWGDAMLRRWYDGLMFFPVWRWLRIIPVSVHLHKSKLLDTERILAHITHEPAAYLADRVSLFLLVRLVNQTQESVSQGDLTQALLDPKGYVQVTDIDKIDAISDRLLQLAIYEVLPDIQPELEQILRHNLRGAVHQADWYQGMQRVPGFQRLPSEALEQLANYLSQSTVELLASTYSDQQGRELMDQLTQKFKHRFREVLRDRKTQQELEKWLTDLLEEMKLNYIQGSADHDPEEILDEAEQMLELGDR